MVDIVLRLFKLTHIPHTAVAIGIMLIASLTLTNLEASAEFKRGENPSPVSGEQQTNAQTVSPTPDVAPNTDKAPESSNLPNPKTSNTPSKDTRKSDSNAHSAGMTLWFIGGGALVVILAVGAIVISKKKK